MEWIISANSKKYDHQSSFEDFGFIDWRQGKVKFNQGDIIYIYSTKPVQKIEYKCIVTDVNLKVYEIRDDKKYWSDLNEYHKALEGNFMKLKLIEKLNDEKLNLANLLLNGLNAAPQGPVKLSNKLNQYINGVFENSNQNEIFPDNLNLQSEIYEGIKTKVIVNKYERSYIAREKCIEHNGVECKICGINFEKTYGIVGKDFIHIHHLTPISTIGKEYKVNYKDDLIPVCPNCHSMLHRKVNGKYLSTNELKEIYNNKKSMK